MLKAVASFPDGVYSPSMADPELLGALNGIANNAYPGYRHSQVSEAELPVLAAKLWMTKSGERSTTHTTSARELAQQSPFLPSPFGFPKPISPEGQLIAELA